MFDNNSIASYLSVIQWSFQYRQVGDLARKITRRKEKGRSKRKETEREPRSREKSRNVGRGVPLIWQPLFDSPTGLLFRSCSLLQALAYIRIPRLTSELHMAQYKSVSPVNSFLPDSVLSPISVYSHVHVHFCSIPLFPRFFSSPRNSFHLELFLPFLFAIPIPRALLLLSTCPAWFIHLYVSFYSVTERGKEEINSDV